MFCLLNIRNPINAKIGIGAWGICNSVSIKGQRGNNTALYNEEKNKELECGPMPNAMVALPNIGGALCSTPQSFADAHYYMPCSNAAKTRKTLKVAGVPQTPETISAASGSKFTIL